MGNVKVFEPAENFCTILYNTLKVKSVMTLQLNRALNKYRNLDNQIKISLRILLRHLSHPATIDWAIQRIVYPY